MKKQFIVGMMIVTSAFTMNAHAAGPTAAKSMREVLVDYVKDIKKYAFGGKTSAAELTSQQSKKAQDQLMKDLDMSVQQKDSVNLVITASKDKKAGILNSLATILGAKKMVSGKSDAESTSIANAADAGVKMLAIAPLVGYTKKSTILSEKEMTETSEALDKLAAMPEQFITFETKSRDSFTNVINKLESATNKRPESVEEAFVKLIMEQYGLTKDQAMAKVRQLKDCT
ncbi:hypothetical protein [Bdellovibrio sp. HCB337]|uniref:hypothetical protein n=1 Tax=Bdellovibrio sp. HCB337 TaxID=3394358 RepID=UPI0039A772F8